VMVATTVSVAVAMSETVFEVSLVT
jgi:hypothetical protein